MTETQTLPVPTSHEIDVAYEPLSEAALGELLAATGNHEGKAVVLLGMAPAREYRVSALHELYVKPQGQAPAHAGALNNQADYCSYSFEPAGLVTKSAGEAALRYELTEKGERYGKAVAGFMLDFSERHPEVALRDLFGMTKGGSEEGRSPLQRIRLMAQLLTLPQPVRVKDLELDLGAGSLDNTARNQLDWLSTAGLIGLESTHSRDLEIRYEIPGPIQLRGPVVSQELTEEVVGILNKWRPERGTITIDDVEAAVRQTPFAAQASVRGRVGGILRALAEDHYLTSVEGLNYHDLLQITLTTEQYDLLSDLVSLLWDIQSGRPDILAEGRRRGQAILADPAKVHRLIAKAISRSPEANKVPREVRVRLISEYLGGRASARTIDVVQTLAGQHGLTRRSIQSTLNLMRKAGTVSGNRQGIDTHWSLREQ